MTKFFPLILILGLMVSSCGKMKDQSVVDDETIQNFLATKKWMATKDPSGLYYIMNVAGTGTNPTSSSTVEVKYAGSLINGTVFDQTATDKTFTYSLTGLIKGWQIGIPLMKKGGKATFIIPSALGYGGYATGPIPANSVLIFDIELIDIK
ncbi:MAG: FKBP-type peptidyl-prolyl cis-trans isomerase [Prolixibacteraceae bacterium]